MARIVQERKACTVNPLKMSAPLGACYAYLGMDRCMPLMHGSQGCTSFGLVLLVRHFREAIPLQTTAMNEVTTILGGMDNIEQALLNIKQRANPALIGIASTGLTETKGDDVPAYLRLIGQRHGAALAGTETVYASTPDYVGGFEEGWTSAVTAIVDAFAQPAPVRVSGRVNLLPGSHLTGGDLDELRAVIAAFGLEPVVVPDVAGSLDGHIPDAFTPTTLGGATLDAVRGMGAAIATIAVGEQMRGPAALLADKCGVAYTVFDRLTGLAACDDLVRLLATLSGRPVPAALRRQRSQLQDAMLDAHFFFGGRKLAIAAEPDLLFATASLCADLGAEIAVAVTTTPSPINVRVPAAEVVIGDLEDFEARVAGCDLLLTHSHGRQASARTGIPLHRIGLPIFDRIGTAHRVSVGYRGTRELVFAIANRFAAIEHHDPRHWPLSAAALAAAAASSTVPEPSAVPAATRPEAIA
jgi:nitrogenase molybdenum-iron protein NifN